jgi:hypothetical protein
MMDYEWIDEGEHQRHLPRVLRTCITIDTLTTPPKSQASGYDDDPRMETILPTNYHNPRKFLRRDTIVVVGQARPKRKRTKAQQQNGAGKSNEPTADEAPRSSTLLENEAEESNVLEPESFDFSAVHNILDDNPDLEDGDRKKKRQKKRNKDQPLPLFPFFILSVGFMLFCSRWSILWGLPCASQGTQ